MIYSGGMGRKKLGRERINITLPKGMAEELSLAAAEEGRDRSDLLTELSMDYLNKRSTKLPTDKKKGRH
jgi:metal-responsive CopG/Arc/MetJ family transcriptional regulator